MTNILTTEDVSKLERGVPFRLPPGAMLTSAARDLARAREIELIFSGSESSHKLTSNQVSASRPGSLARDLGTRGPTPGLWRNLVRGEQPPAASGPAATTATAAAPAVAAEFGLSAFGPRETHLDGCFMGGGPCDRENMVVVTAVGRNRPRVLAELATGIANLNGDIQEISQRIVGGHFHTIFTVDTSRSEMEFGAIKRSLEGLPPQGDYQVHVQHEKVFKYMHRI